MIFGDDEITKEDRVSDPFDAKSKETLFIPNPQDCYNHNDMKVNPRHPRAWFYQLLMGFYEQDPSGKSFKKAFNLYLDAPSDGEQDLSDKEMGRCPQLFTLPQDEETVKDHWEDHKLDDQTQLPYV